MTSSEFQPGCRLSAVDVAVLVVAAIAVLIMIWIDGVFAGVIAFVVGHFYLFCNVFRLSRVPELIWAAIFLSLAIPTLVADWPGWQMTFSVSAAATILLVALEIRQPYYHGLWWEAVNPRLPQWWEERNRTAEGE